MLQEAKDLQQRAVTSLFEKARGKKRELTFKAPTGSGKTRMMADFMNRMIESDENIVFLVSTLSKGGLAIQNYESFRDNADAGVFHKIDPYLISTESTGEGGLHIPTDHNVYVLPRDLYSANGLLMRGPMINFLRNMTRDIFGQGLNKKIYLIKDECHQATNNLDEISEEFFVKVINFSATPNLGRGQLPDVQITEGEAMDAALIKKVMFGSLDDTLEDAINRFKEIKAQYISLDVEPCMIIQISNKGKAEEEWNHTIKPVLDKVENQSLKWMVLVDLQGRRGEESLCDTNDIIKGKLPVSQWKDYAKKRGIDIIIFKMVISEGWDIPRACMLYQIRDSKSKQLSEQVLGRVRRNPRLLDFEKLDDVQKELATTAWVWGLKPNDVGGMTEVRLHGGGSAIQLELQMKTTRLVDITERKEFDIEEFLSKEKDLLEAPSIFELYKKLSRLPNDLQDICYDYAKGDIGRWWKFMENADKVKSRYDNYICDYEKSMVVDEREVTFPQATSYNESPQTTDSLNWVWCKKDGDDEFSFDSQAEKEWAKILKKLARQSCVEIDSAETEEYDEIYLWGKNFPLNSDIKFEYYHNGIHSSYPDFIMKDSHNRIHIFEVKSVNKASGMNIDQEEYEEKVRQLHNCYRACSKKLPEYRFYLPTKKEEEWRIHRYLNGKGEELSLDEMKSSLKEE
jgi:type III restriction enzyme